MLAQDNVELHKRWFDEVWNKGNLAAIDEMMAPEAVANGQGAPGQVIRGPAEFRAFATQLRTAFPDIRLTVEDAFGSEDKVVLRWSAEMTHTGEGMGIAPTGRSARITGISIARVKDGKFVEGWDSWDQLALREQLQAETVRGKSA